MNWKDKLKSAAIGAADAIKDGASEVASEAKGKIDEAKSAAQGVVEIAKDQLKTKYTITGPKGRVELTEKELNTYMLDTYGISIEVS